MDYEKSFINKLARTYEDIEYTKLTRIGWPDYLVLANGGINLYEVKGRQTMSWPTMSLLSKEQKEFFKLHPYQVQLAFYGKNKKWGLYSYSEDNDEFLLDEIL